MKGCVVVLKVVLLVVLVEAAAGASTGTEERVCPPEAGDNYRHYIFAFNHRIIKTSIFDKVVNLRKKCFEELQFTVIKNESTTAEDLHRIFDGICQKKQRFEECMSEKATNLEVCADPTLLKVFNILREFLLRKLESGCDNNAERFVRLYSGNTILNIDQFLECNYNMSTSVYVLKHIDVDISSRMFIFRKDIIAFKKCLSTIKFDTQVREEIDYFFDETISTMQCIHPQDGSLLTCATLDPALVNFTNICDIKTQHNTLNLYDVLKHDTFQWFSDSIVLDNYVAGEEDITTDNRKLREDFRELCSTISKVADKLYQVKQVSSMCLTETEGREINILTNNVARAIKHSCTGDGQRLSDIMFEVYRLKRSSPDQSHAVLECIKDAKLTRKYSDEHWSSSKNMRLYHELETFKECFVNKIRGDQTSVDAATSLINEILGLVKCVNPEDGSTVLCASLMHDHSHTH